MKEKIHNIWKKLAPIHGVIYFVLILICCHFFWKFTVIGDEENQIVTFFGVDISAPFIWMTHHITQVVSIILKDWFGLCVHLHANSILFHSGNGVQIVWSCAGLKQMYIFFCIIAFYAGSWKHKLWYIPAGLILIYIFNIFRITFITFMSNNHPDWIVFLHEYLFKYLFYGFIFLMWMLWEHKFAHKTKV